MSIRVAIAGVGNCASSLVQGVEYYKDTKDEDKIPGLMHNNFGGYRVRDIEFVTAFDVDALKVGKDLSEAIGASQNNTIKFADVPNLGVEVLRIEAFAEPMFGAAIICYGVFVGAAKTIAPSIMNLASMWGVRITLAALLAPTMGLRRPRKGVEHPMEGVRAPSMPQRGASEGRRGAREGIGIPFCAPFWGIKGALRPSGG